MGVLVAAAVAVGVVVWRAQPGADELLIDAAGAQALTAANAWMGDTWHR